MVPSYLQKLTEDSHPSDVRTFVRIKPRLILQELPSYFDNCTYIVSDCSVLFPRLQILAFLGVDATVLDRVQKKRLAHCWAVQQELSWEPTHPSEDAHRWDERHEQAAVWERSNSSAAIQSPLEYHQSDHLR